MKTEAGASAGASEIEVGSAEDTDPAGAAAFLSDKARTAVGRGAPLAAVRSAEQRHANPPTRWSTFHKLDLEEDVQA